jgi:hypothetical protein
MPGLKYITVPESVELKDMISGELIKLDDGKPFSITFKQFVLKILGHESFASSFENVLSAHAVATGVQDAEVGSTVVLAEDDWSKLADGAKKHFSAVGLASLGILQLMPYFNAILKASDTPQK